MAFIAKLLPYEKWKLCYSLSSWNEAISQKTLPLNKTHFNPFMVSLILSLPVPLPCQVAWLLLPPFLCLSLSFSPFPPCTWDFIIRKLSLDKRFWGLPRNFHFSGECSWKVSCGFLRGMGILYGFCWCHWSDRSGWRHGPGTGSSHCRIQSPVY